MEHLFLTFYVITCSAIHSITVQVSQAYSKLWSFREDALVAVHKLLSNVPENTPKDELRSHVKAAVFLVRKAIKGNYISIMNVQITPALHVVGMAKLFNLNVNRSDFRSPTNDVRLVHLVVCYLALLK